MGKAQLMSGPFADTFRDASHGESAFECWQRFVYMAAYEIASSVREDTEPFRDMAMAARKQADPRISAYSSMFSEYVSAVDADPFQDFLGDAFMRLGIGNESGGQFFTPYSIARMLARLGVDRRKMPESGWLTFSEPACGAGANCIGACAALSEQGVDWQHCAYFVCQDVSEITALMCYVQLSVIGAAATVIVGDTLRMERRYRLHTPIALIDGIWTARGMRGDLSDVW